MTIKQIFTDTIIANERREIRANQPDKLLPEYFSGARCRLLINGRSIGAALSVDWSVSADMQEVRTVDSYLPWEIVPGQMTVRANLSRVVDPRRQLGSDSLYSTITSYLHQPYAEIEVRDRMGAVIFLAKGMFKDLKGQVKNGSLGVESVGFIGYYWRENVNQEFDPKKQDFLTELEQRFTNNSLVQTFRG